MDPAPAPAPDAAMTSTQQIIGGDEYIESEEVSHLGENIIDNDAVTAVAGRETDESTSGMASTDAKVEDSSSQTQEDGRRSNVETAAVIRMPSERADDKEKRDSARALRMKAIEAKINHLQEQLITLAYQRGDLLSKLEHLYYPTLTETTKTNDESDESVTTPTMMIQKAKEKVQGHIHLLHRYNDIKDIGMGLMGLIADRRGVRVVDIYHEFGVASHD